MTKENKDQIIIRTVSDMQTYARAARLRGESIGLVPTMGALHAGHLSLVRRARAENGKAIVSVFANPMQFDDPGDLARYPATLDADARAAFGAGADAIFAPGEREMYPEGFSTFVDMTGISDRLCGASRPSHFRGVLTVVTKLFGICAPDRAYFGEKDAQQLAIVKKMASELCLNVEIIGCPTVREADGLAMSSRNARLGADERISARCLFRALNEGKAIFESGEADPGVLASHIRSILEAEPRARIDYVGIVDPLTFETAPSVRAGNLIALAVYIGDTRLVDNAKL